MTQKRTSTFRVLDKTKTDIDLQDLEMSGMIVIVERESDEYSVSLQKIISDVEIGNTIEATIYSKDVGNGVWFFQSINITNKTEINFIKNPKIDLDIFETLCSKCDEGVNNLYQTEIKESGEIIGLFSVGTTQRMDMDDVWSSIRSGTRSQKKNIQKIRNLTSEAPPYGIIIIRYEDFIITGLFSSKSSRLYTKMKNNL